MNTVKSFLIIALLSMSSFVFSQSGWQVVTDSIPNFYLETIQMTSLNTGYACGSFINSSGSFFRTTNGGTNWLRTDYQNLSVDDIFFLNDMTGYVIGYTSSPFYPGKILMTMDGGLTWGRSDSVAYFNLFKIKFYDANTGFIAGKTGKAFVTTNGGTNWTDRSLIFTWNAPVDIWCLTADKWFLGDGQRLNVTTNQGFNWTSDYGIAANTFYFINGTTGFCGGVGSIYKTTNSGVSWIAIFTNDSTNSIGLQFTDNNTGYSVNWSPNRISKTTNGGYNWTFLPAISNMNFLCLSFVNNLTGFAAGYYGRIYKTTNGGSVFVSNISNKIPDRFELGQNYPNPFNQSTIFNLQCSMKSDVTVKVYDAAGREVQTLVNEMLEPGTYQVRFDGSGLSSGLFYYRMTVDGRQAAVKKMIMIK